jgi:hypothetical protein
MNFSRIKNLLVNKNEEFKKKNLIFRKNTNRKIFYKLKFIIS